MLVGKDVLDSHFLLANYKNVDKLREYSYSLIPEEFAHVKELQDNQLYLLCVNLRKLGIQDYKAVRKTIHELLKGVLVTGYADNVQPISTVYSFVDMDRVNLFLERLK